MPARLLLAILLLLFAGLRCARGQSVAGQVQADIAALTKGADRSAGTPAAGAAADYLAGRLARVRGASVFRQSFLLPLPMVERCTATAAGGAGALEIPLAPLTPAGLQISAIDDVPLPLVYAGKGTLEELRGREIARRLVVLEADSSPTAWQEMASLGARGVIFLGDRDTSNARFLDKFTSVPMGLPRFYCDDAAAVASLRGGGVSSLRIDLRARWREQPLQNVLCLIPGRQASPGPANNASWSDALIVLQTRYDAPSQVLTRAPGATQAANAAVLLELAAQIAAAPEHASVLVAFTAGDEWNLRGTRSLLELLGRIPNASRQTALLTAQLARAESRVADADVLAAGMAKVAAGDMDALQAGPVREAVADGLVRESSHVEEALEAARVAAAAAAPGPTPEIVRLEAEKRGLLSASSALAGRVAIGAEQKARIVSAAGVLAPVFAEDLQRLSRRRDALRPWPDIRAAIGPRPPLMLFSLELTAGDSDTFGFFPRSSYARAIDASGQLAGFAQALRRYAPLAANFAPQSLENTLTLESFFPLRRAFSSDAAIAFAQPAGALATIGDPAPRLDTPSDTMDRLNFAALAAQLQGLRALLLGNPRRSDQHGALTDPYFFARTDLPLYAADQEVTIYERAVSESLLRLRAAGTVVGAECQQNGRPIGPPLAGTRRLDVAITTADGVALFPQTLRIPNTRDALSAFTFDDAGRPVRTLIANGSGATAGLATDFYPAPDHSVYAMLFDCQRLDGFHLFDPRGLGLLTTFDILDARRLDRAAFANIFTADYAGEGGGAGGIVSVFFPPHLRWQLLAGRGTASNRLVLINADAEHPFGQGFETTDLAELGPLSWRGAEDLFALDTRRKADLEKFGISNEVIRELHAASAGQLAAGRAARTRHDTPAFLAATDALWSLQQQVYENLIATSNGIIHGVIFLLLGIIPFSYFLERLLVGATNVYRQIGWFALIFALMTGALWFHPAFRISAAPMMIILAFFILILSSTVVYILWGKFDEEIRRLRNAGSARGGETGHITSLQRGAVLGAAVRLGLSNMRRRGARTALTLTTLILLTFTLLCFTSVRESVQVSPTRVHLSVPPPPPGILIRQRAWRELPPHALDLAAALALPPEVTLPATDPATAPSTAAAPGRRSAPGPVVGRWWYASQRSEDIWSLPVKNPATHDGTLVSAILGLDPGEAAFHATPIDTILPRFTAAPANACWLPAPIAAALHVSAGDIVLLAGHRLQVAGVFTDDAFARLRQLTDDPLTPLDPSGSGSSAAVTDGVNGPTNRPEAHARFFPPNSIAVVPAPLARDLGARLTSIMLRPANLQSPQQLEQVAEAFARRADITVYASDGGTVRAINATAAARPQDFSTVLVPMLIAGVIVLNTMLGAVAERTREIHVYTSVGLAPAHVGMLFLAEAAALGTLGVVFGYIFGQGLATLLSGTHFLPGVDLNYSSLSAIVTMGAVLGLVMLSALWPARAASRVAAPSLARDWRLPPPVGDILDVELPFTVNETAARGVCAFLAEFLTTASQTGAGKFTADHLTPFLESDNFSPDPAHPFARGLNARIWLAPYDLGVIQLLRLAIHPTGQQNVFDVRVRLTREAGNPATWHRLNRHFLTDIRKQFLLWRTLPPEAVQRYVEISSTFFKSAPSA
jgi:hypothetical protein